MRLSDVNRNVGLGALSLGFDQMSPGTESAIRGPTVWDYTTWLLALGVPIAILLLTCWWGKVLPIGLAVAGVVLMITTVVRVEIGLFIMAALIPWQSRTAIVEEGLTMIRAAGLLVLVGALPRLLALRGPRFPLALKLAIALVVWAFSSTLANIRPPVLAGFLVQTPAMIGNIGFAFLIWRFCENRDSQVILFVLILLGTAVACVGAFGTGGAVRIEYWEGVTVNRFARGLMLPLFLAPALLKATRSKLAWTVVIGLVLIIVVTLIRTGSRGAVGGVILGAMFFLITVPHSFRRGLPLLVVLALLAYGGWLAATKFGAGELWQERMTSFAEGQVTRVHRWYVAAQIAMQNPLFGVGAGHEGYAFAESRSGFGYTESHSTLVTSLVVFGVPGLVIMLAYLAAVFMALWRLPKGYLRSGLLGLSLALVAESFTHNSLYDKSFWLAQGIFLAATHFYGLAHGSPESPDLALEKSPGAPTLAPVRTAPKANPTALSRWSVP